MWWAVGLGEVQEPYGGRGLEIERATRFLLGGPADVLLETGRVAVVGEGVDLRCVVVDDLAEHTVAAFPEDGAQPLVACDGRVDRRTEEAGVQFPRLHEGGEDQVVRRAAGDGLDEPHAALGVRQAVDVLVRWRGGVRGGGRAGR
jgi:hypothetical protein